MKNILLLTDFSENSKNAIRYALHLFEAEICSFFVLYVQDSATYTTDDLMSAGSASIYDTIVKKSKHKLAKLVSALEVEFKNENHSFQTIVDYDVLTDAIKQTIKLKHIDLIVMGTNGATGAKEVVFGSNTINVIRKVDCPTLVIPEGFTYKNPKNLLLPLDPYDALSGQNTEDLVKFIKIFRSRVHIIRVTSNESKRDTEEKDKDHAKYLFKDLEHQYSMVKNVPMHNVVDSYTQTNPVDMMALLVQKESLFERFFIGSETTQISNHISVPLLIFHT